MITSSPLGKAATFAGRWMVVLVTTRPSMPRRRATAAMSDLSASVMSGAILTSNGGGPAAPQAMLSRVALTRLTSFSSSFRPCSALSPAPRTRDALKKNKHHVCNSSAELQEELVSAPKIAESPSQVNIIHVPYSPGCRSLHTSVCGTGSHVTVRNAGNICISAINLGALRLRHHCRRTPAQGQRGTWRVWGRDIDDEVVCVGAQLGHAQAVVCCSILAGLVLACREAPLSAARNARPSHWGLHSA